MLGYEKCFPIDANKELVVEPGVCFGGYGSDGTVDIDNDDGFYRIVLHTTCCSCGVDVNISFLVGSGNVSESMEWIERPLRCPKCNVLQIKKIRFYVRNS